MVSLIERGHVDRISVRTLRRVLSGVEARVGLDVRWRGGDLNRLLDDRHAALVGASVVELRRYGWLTAIEIPYSRYGERGSIDLLAFHRMTAALLVIEVKSELTSLEETLRRLDAKVRLGAAVAVERLGWQARSTSRLLVLPETTTARRRLDNHAAVLEVALPLRGIQLREWLRMPDRPEAGIRFLPISNRRTGRTDGGGPHRVRRPQDAASDLRLSVQPAPGERRLGAQRVGRAALDV
jgi:hypothetical protein